MPDIDIDTNAEFDDGAKSGIESGNDDVNIGTGITLSTPAFHDEFEGNDEEDLTTYDSSYAVYKTPASTGSVKIDTAQKVSGVSSARISSTDCDEIYFRSYAIAQAAALGKFVFRVRCSTAAGLKATVEGLSEPGQWTGPHVGLWATGEIGGGNPLVCFYNGTTLTSSGLAWAADTWYTITVLFDDTTKKYSATIDGGLHSDATICTNADYQSSSFGGFLAALRCNSPNATGGGAAHDTWFDDMSIGGYSTSGNWTSASQTMTANYRLASLTITMSAGSANTYIDKVEVLDAATSTIVSTYSTNMAATDTLVTGDFDNGFKDTVSMNVKIKLYFVGNGSERAIVSSVEGTYEYGASAALFDDVSDANLLSFMIKRSLALLAPYAEVSVDNNGNYGDGDHPTFTDVKLYRLGTGMFRGRVEDQDYLEDDEGTRISYKCKGYAAELFTQIVESYSTSSRSDMVLDLLAKHGKSLTTSGVTVTAESLDRDFKAVTALDAIIQLGAELGYDFWTDFANIAYWKTREATASGLTITDEDLTGPIELPTKGDGIITSIMVFGDPSLPTQPAVQMDDLESQSFYGVVKTKVVADPSLQTDQECEDYGTNFLAEHAWELESAVVSVYGFEALQPGETVTVALSNYNLNAEMLVVEAVYNWPEETTKLRLAYYSEAAYEHIAELFRRMRKMEGDNAASSIATRILAIYDETTPTLTGTIQLISNGAGFISGHSSNGVLGRTADNIVAGHSGESITTTTF